LHASLPLHLDLPPSKHPHLNLGMGKLDAHLQPPDDIALEKFLSVFGITGVVGYHLLLNHTRKVEYTYPLSLSKFSIKYAHDAKNVDMIRTNVSLTIYAQHSMTSLTLHGAKDVDALEVVGSVANKDNPLPLILAVLLIKEVLSMTKYITYVIMLNCSNYNNSL
jgi:hypothetical protein